MIGDRKSRNATTLFLVSLSAADLLLVLVCAPVWKKKFDYLLHGICHTSSTYLCIYEPLLR